MLEKNSADPLGKRKEKHVVTESGRPIWDGEPRVFACYHSATANEEECRNRREPGETMKPVIVAAVYDRRILRDRFRHYFRKDNPNRKQMRRS